jgi:hypothetical protein
MARLERAKAEWKRFEQEDKPGFGRWMAATFGALMSQLRETEAQVLSKQALVEEVEMEMLYTGTRSPKAAYAKVMRRRNNPAPMGGAQGESDRREWSEPPPSAEEEQELDEFEQTLLFEEFLRVALGMNPDRMSDRQYDKMFAEFKEKLFGQGPPPRESAEEQEAPRIPGARRAEAEAPKPERSRLKELYRLLVRRLHPDTRAEGDTEVSSIWHEVQEAYTRGNVERLEMLLALTDLQSNATGEHTTLAQMRAVLIELRRAFNAIQKNLKMAKTDLAWNFTRTADRSALERKMRGNLEERLDWVVMQLAELDDQLRRWSAPAKSRKPRPAGRAE